MDTIQLLANDENYSNEHLFQILNHRFRSLCNAIEAQYKIHTSVDSAIDAFETLYLSNNRYYHNIRHIILTLELYDIIQQDIFDIEDKIAMQYALIFHDIIYDAEQGDDENINMSIRMAMMHMSDLKMSTGGVARFSKLVKKYIMATHHTQLMNDENKRNALSFEEKCISDIDLYSLSVDTTNFYKNNYNIRQEFKHLSDFQFYDGQSMFLKKILNLEQIYLTEFFGRFEICARKNIENYIYRFSEINNQ